MDATVTKCINNKWFLYSCKFIRYYLLANLSKTILSVIKVILSTFIYETFLWTWWFSSKLNLSNDKYVFNHRNIEKLNLSVEFDARVRWFSIFSSWYFGNICIIINIIHNNNNKNKNTFLQRVDKHKSNYFCGRVYSVHEIINFIDSIIFRKALNSDSWLSLSTCL